MATRGNRKALPRSWRFSDASRAGAGVSAFNELPLEAYPDALLADVSPDHVYSRATARVLCWMAQLVYESDPAKIETVARRTGFEAPALFNRRVEGPLPLADTKGMRVEGRHAVVLAFAGTDPVNAVNWITNFNVGLRADGLHRGFLIAADAVFVEARAAFDLARERGKALFVAGHSLGGAIAALTVSRLRRDAGALVEGVYTYGMPRAGRNKLLDLWGDELGARTFRHVHGIDIVPTLPAPELGFRQDGRLVSCARYARFPDEALADWTSNEPSSGAALANGVAEQWKNFRQGGSFHDAEAKRRGLVYPDLPPGVSDHLPDRYLLALA